MPLTPLGNGVVGQHLEKIEDPTQLIITPDTFRNRRKKLQYTLKVVAVGRGKRHPKSGEIIPPDVQPGDRVILPEAGWTVVKLLDDDGEIRDYISIDADLIVARID